MKTLLIGLAVAITFATSGRSQSAPSANSIIFPDTVKIGDTIKINCSFQIPGGAPGGSITIESWLVCGTDTIPLCSGSLEFIQPNTIVHQLTCIVPDTALLGDCHLLIRVQTPYGSFVIPGGHLLRVLGDHDIDRNGGLDIGDVTSLISFIFSDGPSPQPGFYNADFTCDQSVNISDVVKLTGYIFAGDTLPCFGGVSH